MFKTQIKSRRDEDVCFLVSVENHSYNYVCDCGEAQQLTVKECQNTQAIFISHTHIDHFINFDTILRHQIGIGRKVIITGPRGITDNVQNRIKSYHWNLIKEGSVEYEVREIHDKNTITSVTLKPPLWEQEQKQQYAGEYIFEEKEFVVDFDILDHKTDSICYLFKGRDKNKITLPQGVAGGKWVSQLKAAYEQNNPSTSIVVEGRLHEAHELFYLLSVERGKRVGFILDHAAHKENHEKLAKLFSNSDEVYIECFYKDEDKERAERNYHSYASMSGHIMNICGVKHAVPVHFSRKYSANDIDEIIEQFEYAKNS